MLRRAPILVVLVLVTGSALAACGGDDGDGGGRGRGGSGRSLPLEGTEWLLDQDASGLETVAPSVTVTARFGADGTLSGSSGCNSYTTSFEVEGSSLTVGPQIAGTRRACPPPAGNVEAAYLELLPQARAYAISGKVLTLRTSTKGADLVYRGVTASEAVVGSWKVVNYFRPGAVVSPIAGTTLTTDFSPTTVSGNGGCNQYTGPYEAKGTSITIGPLATTLRACADPAVDQQERDFLAALELARSFTLDGGNLTLLRDGGTIAVTLTKA